MAFQYRFYHTCGHFGLGPIVHNTALPESQLLDAAPTPKTIPTTLTFICPFCSEHPIDIKEGEGILAILSSSTASPFPNTWHIIRVCSQEDVRPEEWSLAYQPGAAYRHMAWVPKPCGEVVIIGEVEEVTRSGRMEQITTLVSCSWRQRRGEPFRSRFAGLMSQMNAALLSGEHAER